jgi:hypothetical protein
MRNARLGSSEKLLLPNRARGRRFVFVVRWRNDTADERCPLSILSSANLSGYFNFLLIIRTSLVPE